MRHPQRRLRSVIVVALSIAAILTLLTFTPRTAQAEKRAISGSLTGQLRMISARMVAGRFSAICPASNQSMTSNVNVPDRREKLSINLAGGKPNVGYEALTPRERFSISIDHGDGLVLQLEPLNEPEGTRIEFTQYSTGAIHFMFGAGKDARAVHAQSVWQLMLIEPEACQTHLIPLMQLIRPGWQLKQQADTIEELLCRSAEGQSVAERAAWQNAVKDLASTRYAVRERAEQKLLDGGQRVLPMLQSLPRAQLDAEQSYRVRRVVRQLTGDGEEDTPDRVAFWLAEDPRVWYALATRDDVAKRRVAATRLSRILSEPLEFNPEGSAEERADQLNRIREQHAETLNPPAQEKTTMNDHRQPPTPAPVAPGWRIAVPRRFDTIQ